MGVDNSPVNAGRTSMNGFDQSPCAVFAQRRSRDDAALEVLVVDDEEKVLLLLGMALPIYGFRVRFASSGEKAIETFRQHRTTIDVILMDILMPGMDGPEALVEIRAMAPEIPVLFMTADSGDYSTQDLTVTSGYGIVAKPFQSLEYVAGQLQSAALAATTRLAT